MTKQLRQDIHTHYQNWLAARGFNSRPSQLQMIDTVADTLLAALAEEDAAASPQAAITAIEAPTGTGKTIAYLVAALTIARALDKKLVISVSTVMLQEQLVRKDLPELHDSGLKFDYALGKGRGRYLCRLRLAQLLEQRAGNAAQDGLYPDEMAPPQDELRLYKNMDSALEAGDWNGDRDAWDGPLQLQTWHRLTVNREQCTGTKCRYYSRCCFYSARQQMRDADCVVANHDLVLTDLFLGDGGLLPPPEDSIYIFDEAHRLGDKALQRFARRTRLGGEESGPEQRGKQLQKIAAALEPHGVKSRFWRDRDTLLETLTQQLGALEQMLRSMLSEHAQEQKRFAGGADLLFGVGTTPVELRRLATETCSSYAGLEALLQRLRERLEAFLDESAEPEARQLAEHWFPEVAKMQDELGAERALWEDYAREDAAEKAPLARWLNLEEDGRHLGVCASPVMAAELLQEELWNRCRAAVLCSATLRALGDFEHFVRQVGLPQTASVHAMPPVFDYANAAEVIVPELGCTPKDTERHTQAVAQYLGQALREQGGTLVLFASRRQLHDVHELLPASLRRRVLLQRAGTSVAELLDTHKRQVDETGRSAILGLASFAEGVDLPGRYCMQLVIAKLFFAPPDDPVAQTLAEWTRSRGGDPFNDIATPDAALRLVQACGRLLRSEQDTGRIVLLDPRVVTMPYGRAILASLPPFPVRSELRGRGRTSRGRAGRSR